MINDKALLKVKLRELLLSLEASQLEEAKTHYQQFLTNAKLAGREQHDNSEIAEARENSQPLRTKTGGSTFKNPPGEKAWQLVDAAGCRGLTMGGAQVSEKHTNFLINTGDATSADIEGLGEEVKRRVYENSGVELEWEIQRVGRP